MPGCRRSSWPCCWSCGSLAKMFVSMPRVATAQWRPAQDRTRERRLEYTLPPPRWRRLRHTPRGERLPIKATLHRYSCADLVVRRPHSGRCIDPRLAGIGPLPQRWLSRAQVPDGIPARPAMRHAPRSRPGAPAMPAQTPEAIVAFERRRLRDCRSLRLQPQLPLDLLQFGKHDCPSIGNASTSR